MANTPRFQGKGSTALIGAGVFAIGAIIYGTVFIPRDDAEVTETPVVEAPAETTAEVAPEPQPAAPEPAVSEPAASEEVAATDDTPEPQAEPEPVAADEAAEPEQDDAPQLAETAKEPASVPLEGPEFDVVRIDPQGAAVIAGSAAPGATVTLQADGEQVAEALADKNGKYVALFHLPASSDPRSLSAEMVTADGQTVPSGGTVLIAPTKPIEVVQAAPKPDPVPETETAAVETPDITEDAPAEVEQTPAPADVAEAAPQNPATPEPEETTLTAAEETEPVTTEAVEATASSEPAPQPASPAIVLADESGVTVLQPAPQPAVPAHDPVSDVAPEIVANLVIDTITYDTDGDVALSGRGQGTGFARVYLNDRAIKTVKIEPDGTWRTPLPDIDAGVYRLRIDEITSAGDVTSRVETPFQREEPEVVAEAAQRPNAVTVQEGFTLWAIARDRFGDGTEYVRVYEANRDLIRDPDLIYPGQIFELPEG